MSTMILKELRQLLPFAFLWLCLSVMFYGAELASIRIDEQSYLAWCQEYCDIGTNVDLVLFTLLFYMIAAYSLFPREFDESTIDHIRSLPIGRSTIFVAKVLAAWILLCLLLLADRLFQILLLSLNTQSITGKTYLQNDMLFLLRDCLFAFVVVCHGVFISWFRTTGLVIYCAYLVLLIWLEQLLGYAGIYSIFRFFSNEYDGPNLLFDFPAVAFHLGVAVVLLIISYFLWTRTDSKPKSPGKGKLAGVVPGIAAVFGFMFVTGWMLTLLQRAENESNTTVVGSLSTDHYVFSYRESDQAALDELLLYVESDYQALVEMLGVTDNPVIQTDLTSTNDHALGLASWKKIRMVMGSVDDVNPLYRRVLSHETAHVMQSVESNRRLASAGNATGFFIEGMAQYTSFEIVPDNTARDSNWLVSAVSWERHNIRFSELANREVFEALYDPEMLYGIGDIWVAAMADVCGVQSLGDFLRSVGREDAPPNFGGEQFWRQHLQYIGCDLESVNSEWRRLMRNLSDNRSAGAFPLFKNTVVASSEDAERVVITTELEEDALGGMPEQFYIRVKSEAKLASTVSPVIPGRLVADADKIFAEYSIPRRLLEGKRFKFQLGYMPIVNSRNYYDKWRSGSIPE